MNLVVYGILLLLSLGAWLLTASAAAEVCFFALLLLPAGSLAGLLPARKRLQWTLDCPATAGKGEPFSVCLRAEGGGVLPRGRIAAEVSVQNALTDERLTLRGRGAERLCWTVESPYCGCLTFRLERARVWDLFGIFSLPVHAAAKKRAVVMPEIYPVPGMPENAPSDLADSQEYAQDRRGQDRTETYQLRPYTAGDSLSLIHWKLSSKLGQMVVRDPALPVDRQLTVLFDRSWDSASPAQADAIGEAVCSVCQALCEAGLPFRLVWTAGERLGHMDVRTPEQLPEAVASLLKARPGETDALAQLSGRGSRLLYFSCRLPESWEEFAANRGGKALLCLSTPLEQPQIAAFPPEGLASALENFSWS